MRRPHYAQVYSECVILSHTHTPDHQSSPGLLTACVLCTQSEGHAPCFHVCGLFSRSQKTDLMKIAILFHLQGPDIYPKPLTGSLIHLAPLVQLGYSVLSTALHNTITTSCSSPEGPPVTTPSLTATTFAQVAQKGNRFRARSRMRTVTGGGVLYKPGGSSQHQPSLKSH